MNDDKTEKTAKIEKNREKRIEKEQQQQSILKSSKTIQIQQNQKTQKFSTFKVETFKKDEEKFNKNQQIFFSTSTPSLNLLSSTILPSSLLLSTSSSPSASPSTSLSITKFKSSSQSSIEFLDRRHKEKEILNKCLTNTNESNQFNLQATTTTIMPTRTTTKATTTTTMKQRIPKTTSTSTSIKDSTSKMTNNNLVTEPGSISKQDKFLEITTKATTTTTNTKKETSSKLIDSPTVATASPIKFSTTFRRSNSVPLIKFDNVGGECFNVELNTQIGCDKKNFNFNLMTTTKTTTTTTPTIATTKNLNNHNLGAKQAKQTKNHCSSECVATSSPSSLSTSSLSSPLSKTTTTATTVPATTTEIQHSTTDTGNVKQYSTADHHHAVHSPHIREDLRYGCAHYKRRTMFVTPCCNKFYKCRFCHDENETHHFDRKTLNELICSECDTRQKVQESCVNCGIRFGKYICLICNLFDDEDKKQYHCDACGICRIGGSENFFHCEVCNMCLPIQLRIDGHKCVENISRSHCPVCLGDIHTSRIPCHIPDCGHLLHKMCFDQLLASGHYTCPTCQTSLIDMSALWDFLDKQASQMTMPKMYENQRIHIFCNDCQRTSKTNFHFIGLKCMECGAYNTTQDVKRRVSLVPDESNTA